MHSPKPKSWARRLSYLCLVALASVLGMATGCDKGGHSHPTASSLPPARVQVSKLEPTKAVVHEDVMGTVRAKLRATLEAKVSGRIQELPVRLGQFVKAGDLIARLDAAEIRARYDQATAASQQAEREFARLKSLYEQQAAARAEYDAAEARFSVAQGAVAETRAMMAYAEIRAPFDGVVTRKHVEVGDLATPGKPLVDLEDPTQLQLVADVPEALAGGIVLDAMLPIHSDGTPGQLQGTVSEIAPASDPLSRTVHVKLDLAPGSKARPGQFARLKVPLGETSLLRVPSAALVKRGQMEMVFAVENGVARMRLVKSGRASTEGVEVVSGLDGGETIVVQGARDLMDGQPVALQ